MDKVVAFYLRVVVAPRIVVTSAGGGAAESGHGIEFRTLGLFQVEMWDASTPPPSCRVVGTFARDLEHHVSGRLPDGLVLVGREYRVNRGCGGVQSEWGVCLSRRPDKAGWGNNENVPSAVPSNRTTLIRVRETGLALQTLPGPRRDTRGKASWTTDRRGRPDRMFYTLPSNPLPSQTPTPYFFFCKNLFGFLLIMHVKTVLTEQERLRDHRVYLQRCNRTWAHRSQSDLDHGSSAHWKNEHFWLLQPKNKRPGFLEVLETRKAKGSLQKHMSGGWGSSAVPWPSFLAGVFALESPVKRDGFVTTLGHLISHGLKTTTAHVRLYLVPTPQRPVGWRHRPPIGNQMVDVIVHQ